MKSLLHTLHDNESILLMYLFDELPPEDRAEVESLLRTDANLQKELDRLRATHEILRETLIVESSEPNRSEAAAAHNAKREIDRWNVERILTTPAPVRRSRMKMALAYGSGIAAAVLLGYLVYWGNSSKPDNPGGGFGPITLNQQQRADYAVSQLGDSGSFADNPFLVARSYDESEQLRKSLDVSEDLFNDAARHPYLSEAEQQIRRATELSQGDPEQDFGQGISQ